MTRLIFNVLTVIIILRILWLGKQQGGIPFEPRDPTVDNSYGISRKTRRAAETREELPQNGSDRSPYEDIKAALTAYFDEERPYLNPELSLIDVTRHLNTNRTYLSQLINREFNMNFYTFVNRYRIAYAVELIRNSQEKVTIEYLIDNAGFKSRSVFYRQFKEMSGYNSPSDMIKKTGAQKKYDTD